MSYGEWRVSSRLRWSWGLLTAMCLLALAALCVAALIATIGGSAYALIVFALALAFAYLSGRACARIPAVAVTISAEEIVIVGPLRTVHVLTHHAERFVPELRPSLLGMQPTVALRYDGYRSTSLWLFTRYGSSARSDQLISELTPLTEELNGALDKAKSASPTTAVAAS